MQITFKTDYGKTVVADIKIKDDEVNILNLEITNDKGCVSFYGTKQCAKHQWPLYCAIKNYLYE